jgi:hypothetical protein
MEAGYGAADWFGLVSLLGISEKQEIVDGRLDDGS